MSISEINDFPNLQIRTNAKGQRRRTTSRNDDLAAEMEKANTPAELAKLAGKYGINEEEIMIRAKSAPNFGQMRMVLGNRMRGIQKRLDEAKSNGTKLTRADAAYPKKPTRATKKASKKMSKKATKKTEAEEARVFFCTETEAEGMQQAHGKLKKVREISTEAAAMKALLAKGAGEYIIVHNGTDDKPATRWILCTFEVAKYTAVSKKKTSKKASKKRAKKVTKKVTKKT